MSVCVCVVQIRRHAVHKVWRLQLWCVQLCARSVLFVADDILTAVMAEIWACVPAPTIATNSCMIRKQDPLIVLCQSVECRPCLHNASTMTVMRSICNSWHLGFHDRLLSEMGRQNCFLGITWYDTWNQAVGAVGLQSKIKCSYACKSVWRS